MAERLSARTASRRTTPQLINDVARSTRTTRSQSREVSDRNGQLNNSKSHRKRARASPENVDSSFDQSKRKRQKGSSGNHHKEVPDLSTVPEDISVAHPQLAQITETEKEQQTELGGQFQHSRYPSKSPGGVSAFSGTTARTSRSAQEMLDQSLEDTMDAIEEITRCSEKLLRLLVPLQISEASLTALMVNLQTKGSRLNRNLNRLSNTFSTNRARVGNSQYIANQEIVESLLGKNIGLDDETGRWRPDALMQRANLAELAMKLLSCSRQNMDDVFGEEFGQVFPNLFITRFVSSRNENLEAGSSIMLEQTFQLTLELRTQYAIMLLERHVDQPEFDSDSMLRRVFYKDATNLREWTSISTPLGDFAKEAHTATLSRLKKMREAFTTPSVNARTGIEHLRSTFPWMSFVQQSTSWIKMRLAELNSQITGNGGFEEIFKNLDGQAQNIRSNKSSVDDANIINDEDPQIVLNYNFPSEASNVVTQPQARRSTGTKILKMGQFNTNSSRAREATAHMKQIELDRKARLAANRRSLQVTQDPGPDIQVTSTAESSNRASILENTANEARVPSPAAADSGNQQEAVFSREDSWRPQEDDRIEPIGMEDDRMTLTMVREIGLDIANRTMLQQEESNKENMENPPQTSALPASGQKPRYTDPQPNASRISFESQFSQPESLSAGEEFQTQQPQPIDIATKRGAKPAFKRPITQPSIRQRSSLEASQQQETGRDGRLTDEPSLSPDLDDFRFANAAAKERKNLQRKPQRVQSRKPWSDEETRHLLNLIAMYGTSWALLMQKDKRTGMLLQDRNQVGLKDKARNVKMDYLRAGRILPENFDRIPISKLMIDKLGAEGISYNPAHGQRTDAE